MIRDGGGIADATSSGIGSLKLTELRERARRELGDRFDIRAFHDEVLGAGALPMDEETSVRVCETSGR